MRDLLTVLSEVGVAGLLLVGDAHVLEADLLLKATGRWTFIFIHLMSVVVVDDMFRRNCLGITVGLNITVGQCLNWPGEKLKLTFASSNINLEKIHSFQIPVKLHRPHYGDGIWSKGRLCSWLIHGRSCSCPWHTRTKDNR